MFDVPGFIDAPKTTRRMKTYKSATINPTPFIAMKNCMSVIRRHETCRVKEFLSSHYPNKRLRAFLVTKSQLHKGFLTV